MNKTSRKFKEYELGRRRRRSCAAPAPAHPSQSSASARAHVRLESAAASLSACSRARLVGDGWAILSEKYPECAASFAK